MVQKIYQQKEQRILYPLTVYTVNIYDGSNDDALIWIDQAIPNTITQYSSAADAMAALDTLSGFSVLRPVYLKHIVTDNEFVITDDLVASNSSLTAGTYAIQGERMCDWDPVEETTINCRLETSQYYEQNVLTLQTAFGAANCHEDVGTYPDDYTFYSCGGTYS